jgi:Flp pilus assembly protein TadB
MTELLREKMILFLVLGLADIFLGVLLSKKICLAASKQVQAALGTRRAVSSFHRRCSAIVWKGVDACEKQFGKGRLHQKARAKMQKAGYRGEYAALVYLSVRFVLSPIVFIAAFIMNFPDFVRPMAAVLLINVIMELVVKSNTRKVNLRFQKCIYKIYKYLHNQISSGVKPTDAVRSVYEVTEDKELRGILVRLAARYELTLDIDSALEEFKSNFDTHEAQTLCIAIKQGIETGDNKELLAKQEDIMFKKYFNYVQAETDSCRNRSVAAATVYAAIVVVMIIVPMLSEVNQAIGNIFIN